jgi:hypothetical protein
MRRVTTIYGPSGRLTETGSIPPRQSLVGNRRISCDRENRLLTRAARIAVLDSGRFYER